MKERVVQGLWRRHMMRPMLVTAIGAAAFFSGYSEIGIGLIVLAIVAEGVFGLLRPAPPETAPPKPDALRKAERLATVAIHARDAVVVSDRNGQIEWVNDGFVETTGYTQSDAVGRTPAELLNGPETDPKTIQAISNSLAAKRPIRIEVLNYRKNGKTIWVETSLMPVLDEDGEIEAVVGVERDISAAKLREAELAAARIKAEEAASAKSKFLATMSHEIRTPMNGIIGMADLLDQTQLDATQRDYLHTISGSAEALLQIINDILDYSRLGSERMTLSLQPMSLKTCVSDALRLLAPLADAKGLQLQSGMTGIEQDEMIGDDGRIRQIILNLVGNAIKFTADGGVRVITAASAGTDGRVSVSITVEDDGIGIAQEQIDAVFESFSQAEEDTHRTYGGTGLGLPISRMLARKMGGDITVQSQPGAGSIFTFATTFSAVDSPAEPGATHPDAAALPADIRILIAEDNLTNRTLVQAMLKPYRADLTFAKDGAEAIECFHQHAPDLILMDIQMPKMDGMEATRQIRAFEQANSLPTTPITALTANAYDSDRDNCTKAGMTGFLSKPIRKQQLIDEIARQLRLKDLPEVRVEGRSAKA